MAEQRDELRELHDPWRRACLLEPRGNDVLVGALYCPPVSADATLRGDLLQQRRLPEHVRPRHHRPGSLVAAPGPDRTGVHKIDTPVGQVSATLHEDGAITVGNVPAYRYRQQVAVDVPGHGVVHGDIAWGGNWFFLVPNTASVSSWPTVRR